MNDALRLRSQFANPKLPLIGLNGRFLIAQRTGVQRSAYRLFRSIIEHGQDYNFVLFTGASEQDAPEWVGPNVQVVVSALSPKNILRNYLWEQFLLPVLARKYQIDLLHNPANLAPIFYSRKSIVNIHDLCFLIEPSWFTFSFRFVYNILVPIIARKAAMIITNSNYSKNDILEHLDVPVYKVRAAHWAVDPIFSKYVKPYATREDRILYVGSIEPRKNLGGLLTAFNSFKRKNPHAKCKLTLVGCENSVFASQEFDLGEYKEDIEFLGYVSDKKLAQLYSVSRMFVYPSFYEGFGFPPLEAMAAGTPVITSWNSSLPEVVGHAALLANPADPEDIAKQIERLYFDPELAARLADEGLLQVKKFSWERVGKHTLSLYRELLQKDLPSLP